MSVDTISWGSIVGSYGKLGIDIVVDETTNTTVTLTACIYFWSKYSVSDDNNTLYVDFTSSGPATTSRGSKSISTTVSTGTGWSTSNRILIGTYKTTVNRQEDAVWQHVYAKLANVDRVGGTMYASNSVLIPALPSYTITYNANGGSGAPSSQTKIYGKSLTLSSTKPTRTGYSFEGWASPGAASWDYAPGAIYTKNASTTLSARWKANTYTITYNANGGSGAPSSQTATYGTKVTLWSTVPVRANYVFKEWSTSANGSGGKTYNAGATCILDANVTLYAVWELAYVKPRIFKVYIDRCDSNGTINPSGTSAVLSFSCISNKSSITYTVTVGSVMTYSAQNSQTAEVESAIQKVLTPSSSTFSTDTSYPVTLTVSDSGGSTTVTTTLNSSVYAVDFLSGGMGVAFGKAAELDNTVEFDFDAKFNNPVYGNALGMNRLPTIPANSDLNNYMTTGCYAVHTNANAGTISNIPVNRAGRLEVWASTGEGIREQQWSYLRQRFVPYNGDNAVWERDVWRGSDNVWIYYGWYRSTLTPAISEKVYSKAAMTIGLTANKTLGVVGAYTKIPFDKNILSTNNRLTLSENSVRIGSNITRIKVSGQTLIQCKEEDGNRFAKISRTSGSTTTYGPWIYSTGVLNANMVLTLTPMIMSVTEGDLIGMLFYTYSATDVNISGSSSNGYQTFLTVEEI